MAKVAIKNSSVRIIAGCWRGRKIEFPTNLSIRPTPDRVRETLFNWLAPYIINSRCLDLYAGSGVLGFEALSRGATGMVFVDLEKNIIDKLQAQHKIFNIGSEYDIEYHCGAAEDYLRKQEKPFDLVFLDPPYQTDMVEPVIIMLADKKLVSNNGVIYVEMAKAETLPKLPPNWRLLKNKVMGQVACYLLQVLN